MNKEETLLRKRLVELSRQAYHKDIVTFSDFLNLNELNILHTTPKDLFPARYETFGGYEMAERQMVAFYLMLFIMSITILYRYLRSVRPIHVLLRNWATGIIWGLL